MRVISSQRFLDDYIVEEKIEEFEDSGVKKLVIPVVNAFTKDPDGEDLYIMADCHHRLAAARDLGGIEIEYEEIKDVITRYIYFKNKAKGYAVLTSWYMDSPWYYVETGEKVW